MKETILKFRKLYDILLQKKGYTRKALIMDSKICWATLKKILEGPVEEMKINASVLASLQDFIRIHSTDFILSDDKSKESKPGPEKHIILERDNALFPSSNLHKYNRPPKEPKPTNQEFWDVICFAQSIIPDNVQLSVIIIAKKK